MIAYSCNLACKGCISLSDFDRDGIASLEDITAWCKEWHTVISPGVITLFGGEPTLHPRLIEVCKVVKQYWPQTTLRLITNGYLLENFPADAWFNLTPFEIQVSIHRKDHETLINQKIKNILAVHNDWAVTQYKDYREHKQLEWSRSGFKLYKSIFGEFVSPYLTKNNKLIAANGDPTAAHSICGAPNTPVLYKNNLYKCPAVANVMELSKENWFGYQAVASTDDLTNFISSIGKPESVCAQCPDKTNAVIFNHLDRDNVIVKQKSLN
jgi:organic radical activating enzyme